MTSNLEKRIKSHNNGKVKDRREARKKERYFKSGFGRKYIKNRIKLITAPSSNG